MPGSWRRIIDHRDIKDSWFAAGDCRFQCRQQFISSTEPVPFRSVGLRLCLHNPVRLRVLRLIRETWVP